MRRPLSRLTAGHPLQLILGLTIWSLWFVALYGGLSVACAVAPPAPTQGAMTGLNLWLGLLTLATLGLLGWLARVCLTAAWRGQGGARFMAALGAGLHLFSAAGVAFVGLPLVVLPPCL
ncbi:hypothetical protein [Halomonas kalidii]|uniref:DUF4149 domain-containing protein n=1 Tax=Halomonas kalidii TaxID=3043293 RepID=A0ABT6VJG5_9GAMM|nr:hypothetical protein [Halomonas kalidii]MDI5934125.1 hypothetical protein [Halomonas kalidii]